MKIIEVDLLLSGETAIVLPFGSYYQAPKILSVLNVNERLVCSLQVSSAPAAPMKPYYFCVKETGETYTISDIRGLKHCTDVLVGGRISHVWAEERLVRRT